MRRHKRALRPDVKVSTSGDQECKENIDMESRELETPTTHRCKSANDLEPSEAMLHNQPELLFPPSIDCGSEQGYAEFSVSACNDRAPIQQYPAPMSFTRRIMSHIQSLVPGRSYSRSHQRDIVYNTGFADDFQYSVSETYGDGLALQNKTQDIIHVIHQGTEGTFLLILFSCRTTPT